MLDMSDKPTDTQARPFTASSLAAAAGVSVQYIARLCKQGKIEAQKVGPVWLISYDVGAAWIAERKTKQARP